MARKPTKSVSPQFVGEEFQQLRDFLDRRLVELRMYRSSYFSTWMELSNFVHPQRGRFSMPPMPNSGNKGQQRQQYIIDRIATQGVKRFASFLLQGICSPEQAWFLMSISDKKLAADATVKAWLSEVTDRMMEVLNASNFYEVMAGIFEELPTFGTGAAIVLQDYHTVVRLYLLTAGEYLLGLDERLQVNTLYREYLLTVEQVIKEFGIDNVSDQVRSLHESQQLGREVNIVQAVMPNPHLVPGTLGWRGKPFVSVHYEYGHDTERCLRVAGFMEFPAVAPRWMVVGNDVYGHGPAEEALPDVKTLQLLHRRAMQLIEKRADPPMVADASLQASVIDLNSGAVNFVPGLSNGGTAGLKSIYDINHDISGIDQRIQDTRESIKAALYNDLITLFSSGTGPQMTAEEVRAKSEEKLLLLGPMLERFHSECLTPILDQVFNIMARGGLLPPPPPHLQGRHIEPSYVSMMAQAQRAVGTSAIEGVLKLIGNLSAAKPEALDLIDVDQTIRIYTDKLGADPHMLAAPDAIAAVRKARSQQQQQQMAMQQSQAAASGAQTLSQTDLGNGKNALSMMLGQQ